MAAVAARDDSDAARREPGIDLRAHIDIVSGKNVFKLRVLISRGAEIDTHEER